MSLPLFVSIEASSPDPGRFPISIAWSLPDGTIKSVLISPDDDWEPWDNSAAGLDIHFLYDQGVSGLDVIREMNQDLSGQTVFTDGLDDYDELIDMLFESFDEDPDFELEPCSRLFSGTYEEIMDLFKQVAQTNELNTHDSEDNVRCLLFMSQELDN